MFIVEKGLFYIEIEKMAFSRFVIPISYMGIQGVTRGYKGLQGLARAYRGLQGITGAYRGLQGQLQGVKRAHKG